MTWYKIINCCCKPVIMAPRNTSTTSLPLFLFFNFLCFFRKFAAVSSEKSRGTRGLANRLQCNFREERRRSAGSYEVQRYPNVPASVNYLSERLKPISVKILIRKWVKNHQPRFQKCETYRVVKMELVMIKMWRGDFFPTCSLE